jgi:integrase
LQLAKLFYEQHLIDTGVIAQGAVANTQDLSVNTVANIMLANETARVKRDEITNGTYVMLVSRIRKWVLPYFGAVQVTDIKHTDIERFLYFLSDKQYKSMTITQYLNALHKVLECAFKHGWIEKIPTFPKLKSSSTPRGGFSVVEYRALLRASKVLANQLCAPIKVTHRTKHNNLFAPDANIPREMTWLIGFMVNSFVRPVDMKLMQHKHIEVIRNGHIYLRLTIPETKRHSAPVITLQPAVRIYEHLRNYYNKQGLATADDYLFLPQIKDRAAAMQLIDKYFVKVLLATGLRFGALGQRRTLYSLRHTAITYRLLYGRGIDLLTLARNARTSVEMIERFYASQLTPEMNVGMLHSRR